MKIEGLKKWFPVRRGIAQLWSRRQEYVHAVDGLSFDVKKGKIFGLVGESGCGKTTTGRLIGRLIEPTDGNVYFEGQDIFSLKKAELKRIRRKIQMIFQDPYDYLSPRLTVFDIISEPLLIHKIARSKAEKEKLVEEVLESVRLNPKQNMYKRPHELSGGERQRVAIGRSLVLRPTAIVADEPVSMLDVSVRSGVLNLMLDLNRDYDLTMIFITHDISVSRYMCDRAAIMYLGQIKEVGLIENIVNEPLHPYAQALIAVVPTMDPTQKRYQAAIEGKVPSPIKPPGGCRFHPRCHKAMEICCKEDPRLVEVKSGHYVACHLYR